MLGALIAIASFILGVRLGLAVGYRAERGRRIVVERKWLGELAHVLGARAAQLESVDATRARLLDVARDQTYAREREPALSEAGPDPRRDARPSTPPDAPRSA